ncbi:DUF547 domain-containing protein [Desulfobacula sp.]|uniref:DUF547 domain-containing protein n=1 Tax=Desulfobacula sp. TaxID=2593537 RepID=UPI00263580A5|nr:DUF547 domain-containing protein [Desulfobacula sp.]
MQKGFKYIAGLSILFLFFADHTLAKEDVGNRIYASLLKKHVTKKHVNYDGFKKDEKLLDEYLAILSHTDAKSLSKNNRFAFYINAYNAFTIKLVLTKYPDINSIKEIGGFFSNPWNKKFILLQKKTVSLDYIEHKIIRPKFKDPRVHFAINCASKSCPPLRDEPYKGETLENQLNDQTREFINDKKNNFIKGDTLFVSKIFKWFEADFSDNSLMFIKRYASKELKEKLNSAGNNMKIAYLYYDWSLNR